MGTLWLYWERPKDSVADPPHIRLCRKSVQLHASGHDLRLVTPQNLSTYLPGLPHRLFEIQAEPAGRLDKYLNRRRLETSAIAQRADFVRAFLLEKYGGFYLDSDAILLADPTPYFDLLDRYDFCAMRRSSFGKTHASVGFYGSRRGGVVISEYTGLLRNRLRGSLYYGWNEIGSDMLTPVVDRNSAIAFNIPEREIQPVTFENAGQVFTDRSLELADVVEPETRIFMLYSGPFRGPLRYTTLDGLYRSDMLISKAFRAAIPESVYQELLSRAPHKAAF